jgi:type II secretory pathway component PulC
VNEVLDAGLGKFLQRVELRPQLQEGTFVGFRVLELRPPAWWQGVDLVPGDVVTRVNGMPIEQPTDAHAAFESLRQSDKLVVSYLREGEARELSYSIIEKPSAAKK